MFSIFKYKPVINSDQSNWIKEIYDEFHKVHDYKNRNLILPTNTYFKNPENIEAEVEEDLIKYYIDRIIELSNIGRFDYKVCPHASASEINKEISAFGGTKSNDPGGTYRIDDDGVPLITYDSALLDRPIDIICTLVHEICHHLIRNKRIEKINEENEEYATDLYVIYLGFGLFSLRSCLRMENWTSGQSSGWSIKRSGYLNIYESGYALAYFVKKNDIDREMVLNHVSDLHEVAFLKGEKQLQKGL